MSAAVATPKHKVYQMPCVEQGTRVLWYPGGDWTATPYLGVVVAVNGTPENPVSVAINTFANNNKGFYNREGVRHMSDPYVQNKMADVAEQGSWDYAPPEVAHQELVAKVEALEERVERLMDELGARKV